MHNNNNNKKISLLVWDDQVYIPFSGQNPQKKHVTISSDWSQTDLNLQNLIVCK